MRFGLGWIASLLAVGCGARSSLPDTTNFGPSEAPASTVLLFGGIDLTTGGGSSSLGDTWSWTNAGGWRELHPAASPSPRFGSAAATLGAETVLFGGNGPVAETWVWNGTTWAERQPAGSPPALSNTVLARQGSGLVLFDGQASGVLFHDVWSFDGASWSHPNPAITPPAREGAAGAVLDDKLVIFGGEDVNFEPLGDTWVFDGASWTELHPAHAPSPRRAAAAAVLNGRIVLFGGDTLAPPQGSWVSVNETWIWDGSDWTQATAGQAPDARSFAGMAAISTEIVLFGGAAFGTGQAPSGTWTWDGSTWTKAAGPEPSPRNEPTLAAR